MRNLLKEELSSTSAAIDAAADEELSIRTATMALARDKLVAKVGEAEAEKIRKKFESDLAKAESEITARAKDRKQRLQERIKQRRELVDKRDASAMAMVRTLTTYMPYGTVYNIMQYIHAYMW